MNGQWISRNENTFYDPNYKYTTPIGEKGYWNTREIKHFFEYLEEDVDKDTMASFLSAMGWTPEQYKNNIEWTEDLIRNYHKDEESAVLW